MIVVSDSSVLINLAWINQLDLLPGLYTRVAVPTAVWREVVEEGAGKPGASEIKRATWLDVIAPTNSPLVHSLRLELDPGEAESIALAIEQNADLVLMDERIGRAVARHFNLSVIGLIGVLISAKQAGLLGKIQPLLDQLRHVAGFYISDRLYHRVLNDIGELH